MAHRVFCRFCGTPDYTTAGAVPKVCKKCEGEAHWTTEPYSPLIERQKRPARRPRVKFATTQQDYRLFLRRIKISAE